MLLDVLSYPYSYPPYIRSDYLRSLDRRREGVYVCYATREDGNTNLKIGTTNWGRSFLTCPLKTDSFAVLGFGSKT